jgi:serine/threonine protein kinase
MPSVSRRFAAGELVAQGYLLLDLLGRGATGEVFRARDLADGCVLAVKLLVEQNGSDAETVQKLFREARAINRIGHPSIVSVVDFGYDDGIPYLAMEYLGGESLAQILERSRRLPPPCVAAVMLRVLDALAAVHKANIVHRGLRPANVFLQASAGFAAKVKLLDVGIGRLREDGGNAIRTASGMLGESLDYLSPEQIAGDREIDGRSDLFAAGAMMFELLTGKRPFHGPTFVATTYRILHEDAPPLSEAGGPDDPRWAQILARALCKKREERFGSAVDLARELEKLLPETALRETALRQLPVRSPTGDERWMVPTPLTPPARIHATLSLARRETPRRVQVEPRATVETTEPYPELLPEDASSLRASPPVVGRRRTDEAPRGNVRGNVLRAMDRAIAGHYGSQLREEVVSALPREAQAVFRAGPPSAEAWYSIAQVAAYLESSNRLAVHGEAAIWHGLGNQGGEADLHDLVLSAGHQPDGHAALRAVLPAFSGLFDFGQWSLEGSPESLRIHLRGFSRTPRSLHDWLSGVVERVARASGRPYQVAVARQTSPSAGGVVEFVAVLPESISTS